jgi:hypothetical protein
MNKSAKVVLGNNRPLPSLARPSLLHRLDREGSKIFVHPLGTRLDVCNGRTRSLSQCHLVWWTNAKEPRRISKPLHKSDAAPRLEHPIDVTRSIVGDESPTCRQHLIRAQDRVFNRACSRCTQEDRRCDRVPCQQKHRFLPDTHTRIHDGGECQHNENTQTLPSGPQNQNPAVATRREGHRSPRSGREGQRRHFLDKPTLARPGKKRRCDLRVNVTWPIPAANSWRTPPSRPRASARSRASACDLRGARRQTSTSTTAPPALPQPS